MKTFANAFSRGAARLRSDCGNPRYACDHSNAGDSIANSDFHCS
jgi:hypothetical protein